MARRPAARQAGEALAAAAAYSGGEAAGERSVAQNAIAPAEIRDGKIVIRYFVCYSHADRKEKEELVEKLQHALVTVDRYDFRCWSDIDIDSGDKWHDEIQQAIARCHFGLLLVSRAFFSSTYIGKHELPHFVAADPSDPVPGKRAIPVALKQVLLKVKQDLRGLEDRQIFHDSDGKAYADRGGTRRDAFAGALCEHIVRIVEKHFASPAPKPAPVATTAHERAAEAMRRQMEEADPAYIARLEGQAGTLDKLEPGQVGERRDAMEFLDAWVRNPQGQPYCALLGEYGMGKTTTCMELTRQLLDARQHEADLPMPIYLDLRNLGDKAKQDLSLADIIETVLKRSWRSGRADAELSAADVIRLVQEEGALAIFDGLDEVLVHLTPAAGQAFTREIFRILPPNLLRRRMKTPSPGRAGRLLVTCRTHYFRTLRDQAAHLTGQDRDGVEAGNYQVFVLLPLTEAQIRTYFSHALPGLDPETVLETIRAVHNLPELAQRPYTLSLIARHIEQIERWRQEGRAVTGVDLYRHMVLSWLERDGGKHQLTPDHKQRLMEYFSAALWRSGKRAWSANDLEQWLMDFLTARPEFAAHYAGKDREVLKEDLRTATFLVRDGEDNFRFAHTSLQEFFLAGYLLRALTDRRLADWAMAVPSRETLDFLGQMLFGMQAAAEVSVLRSVFAEYRPLISELALAYALLAHEKGYPAPGLSGAKLDGAKLAEWTIAGKPGELLNMAGASFRGAEMRGTHLSWLNVERADFTGADLRWAELFDSRARLAFFDEAALAGAIFCDVHLRQAGFADAQCHYTQWLKCDLLEARGVPESAPAGLRALCRGDAGSEAQPEIAAALAVLGGHVGSIRACVFSPDGSRIASAGDDGTLRLWDAEAGTSLMALRGHEGTIWACAFSPDGSRIASAGDDGTLRLWNAEAGTSLMVLRSHEGWIRACTFSPDGSRIVSAGDDGTLRLWDAEAGTSLMVLRGHEGWIMACAFSPDGSRIASAGGDGTVRLWDAEAGTSLMVLRGHQGRIMACAFSPDGRRIASADTASTLRLWDAEAGTSLMVLRGHERGIMACAFSPDGSRIASAGGDGTLRLWDAEAGTSLMVLRGHERGIIACAFSPDGSRIASAGDDGTLRLWDAETGTSLMVLRGHKHVITACAFSPDGSRIAGAGDDGTLRLWDAEAGTSLMVLRGHQGWIMACAFSPDGRRIASAGHDGTLRLWDAEAGTSLMVLRGHEDGIRTCAFSPDGSRIASAGDDRTLRLWDAEAGTSLMVLDGHDGWVNACAFSPDGSRIASAGDDGTLRLWDAEAGTSLMVLRGHKHVITACAFSPDGSRIASASGDVSLRLWDAEAGTSLIVLRGHEDRIRACVFSPDGRRIASAGDDGTVRLWDADAGTSLIVLRGHQGGIMACAFSPDGSRIASAGRDGTLRLWDAATGGECGFRIHLFRSGAFASVEVAGNRINQVGGDAWRWLGWVARDPAHGVIRYPAEIFGPLPE